MAGGVSEFTLIARYLTGLGSPRADVLRGVGDDAAIVRPPAQPMQLLALDTLVEGVHFPADCPAEWVGYRALAVNLSDMAAMGADPCWALVGLTLPTVDVAWVADFAAGLDGLARDAGVAIVGGDVTRGALTVSVQISGSSPGPILRRDGAQAGDRLWVSGRPGEAAAGLNVWQGDERHAARWQGLRRAFLQPQPRLDLGRALRGVATAAIDVSDGLAADAGHIAAASGVGIVLAEAAVRPSARLRACLGSAQARHAYLAGGDDYELCFAAPESATAQVVAAARRVRVPVRQIGRVVEGEGVHLNGVPLEATAYAGYQHFAD